MWGVFTQTGLNHIRNISTDVELTEETTCREFRQVQMERKRQASLFFDYYLTYKKRIASIYDRLIEDGGLLTMDMDNLK